MRATSKAPRERSTWSRSRLNSTSAWSALPADRIWGDTDRPVLRLITCGGSFDSSTGHDRDNVVVYASPTSGPTARN